MPSARDDILLCLLQTPPEELSDGVFKAEGPPKLVHVRFTFDRTPLRRMHAALEHAFNPCFQLLPVSISSSFIAIVSGLSIQSFRSRGKINWRKCLGVLSLA